jgi:hypothetical protein
MQYARTNVQFKVIVCTKSSPGMEFPLGQSQLLFPTTQERTLCAAPRAWLSQSAASRCGMPPAMAIKGGHYARALQLRGLTNSSIDSHYYCLPTYHEGMLLTFTKTDDVVPRRVKEVASELRP